MTCWINFYKQIERQRGEGDIVSPSQREGRGQIKRGGERGEYHIVEGEGAVDVFERKDAGDGGKHENAPSQQNLQQRNDDN